MSTREERMQQSVGEGDSDIECERCAANGRERFARFRIKRYADHGQTRVWLCFGGCIDRRAFEAGHCENEGTKQHRVIVA